MHYQPDGQFRAPRSWTHSRFDVGKSKRGDAGTAHQSRRARQAILGTDRQFTLVHARHAFHLYDTHR